MAIIKCSLCQRDILEYDADEVSKLLPNDVIRARHFRSVVPNYPGPYENDVMKCPYCNNNCVEAIQRTWKEVRELAKRGWFVPITEREWDK